MISLDAGLPPKIELLKERTRIFKEVINLITGLAWTKRQRI